MNSSIENNKSKNTIMSSSLTWSYKSKNLLHVVLMIRRQNAPSLHSSNRFIYLVIFASVHEGCVWIVFAGSYSIPMKEVECKERIPAGTTLIIMCVAINKLLDR
mmetsp:Transcript_10860/g.19745  ORF Transcript_10860/g.19745 Transcript_10860/m.19745 type:complete len:104 (-) Transcript_10860:1327-1638(-)